MKEIDTFYVLTHIFSDIFDGQNDQEIVNLRYQIVDDIDTLVEIICMSIT